MYMDVWPWWRARCAKYELECFILGHIMGFGTSLFLFSLCVSQRMTT